MSRSSEYGTSILAQYARPVYQYPQSALLSTIHLNHPHTKYLLVFW
uniref:AT-HF n=1 Tax=Arundo donax TaxID=35708 RepID=A0A0A9EGW0_ARUDO